MFILLAVGHNENVNRIGQKGKKDKNPIFFAIFCVMSILHTYKVLECNRGHIAYSSIY